MSQVSLSLINLPEVMSNDCTLSELQSNIAKILSSHSSFSPEERKKIVEVFVNKIEGPQNLSFAEPERVKSALSHLTSFECGKEQLRDLAEICSKNGLKICFALNDNCSFENRESNGSKFLVVSIPKDIKTLNNRTFFKTSYQEGTLHVERVKYASLGLSDEEIDGVHIGHELSHATIAALLGGDDSDFNKFKEDLIDALCHELISSVETIDNKEDISKDIKLCLKKFLIKDGEEARNILGLDLEKFKNSIYQKNGNKAIICELDFLKEKNNMPFVRLPYQESSTYFNLKPELCKDIINAILQLSLSDKIEGITLEKIKNDIEDYEKYSIKHDELIRALEEIGWYETKVTCDGNDGFYAILAYQEESQYHIPVKVNDNNWKKANELRNRIFGNDSKRGEMTKMSVTTFDSNAPRLTIEHLPRVAAYCNENYNRSLICIDITAEDPQKTFILYGKNNRPLFLGEEDFFKLLQPESQVALPMSPIVLVHNYGYWTAVVDGNEYTTSNEDISQGNSHHGCCPCNIC